LTDAQRWASVKVIDVTAPARICLTLWHFLAILVRRGHCNAQLMAKKKDPAAVELGRKGGKASAERLTDEQRKEKARKAARARWTKRQKV
jgi:hypothetical protein